VNLGSGSSNILVNPDGTHSQIIGNGNSKIIVNPNGTHSILFSQDNSQQKVANPYSGYQPFFLKKRGTKTIILSDGSVLHFKKVKKKKSKSNT
tara:strand:+ start:4136 stop:4414 length:279 start_codon:yes stop_codon:yes gene_type:complete